jgi:fido (protein-threonine AMPylation protein)
VTAPEVATLSLARAHWLLSWIVQELSFRQIASLALILRNAEPLVRSRLGNDDEGMPLTISRGYEFLQAALCGGSPVYGPLRGSNETSGQLLAQLLEGPSETLSHPMDIRYIHALHRISMMGVIPSNHLGRYRRGMVHVGDPEVVFPPPAAIDALMTEFCGDFPAILSVDPNYDPIPTAARFSYRFVRIHPYLDGNGRVSRLLMNLILFGRHPLVSLSPHAKERRRYHYAINRANRGNTDYLSCLIAISLRDTYRRMLDALGAPR